MTIPAINPVPLNPPHALLPVPDPGTKASDFLSQNPGLLPIPETGEGESSVLSLLVPTPLGQEPRALPEQKPVGLILNDPTAPLTQGLIQTEAEPLSPPGALTLAPMERISPTAAVPPEGSTLEPESALVAVPEPMDPLPAMLQSAYRAPLNVNQKPMFGWLGEPAGREPAPFHVDAADAVRPREEQAGRQAFNPYQPADHSASKGIINAYGLEAIQGPFLLQNAAASSDLGAPDRHLLDMVV